MTTIQKTTSHARSVLLGSVAMRLVLLSALTATPLLTQAVQAQEAVETEPVEAQEPTVAVQGRVELPKEMPEGVNVEGISLDKAVITLQGHYKHPRRPYPENWRELTREERRQWSKAFEKSEAFQEYERKVEVAKSKRKTFTTKLAEDGSFSFENIKPAWYQLTVMVMHPKATGEPSFELARAHALRQFIIKDKDKPYGLGTVELKLKNVLMPGDNAPNWAATGYDGAEYKISDFRGQYVLFDFWATWCGPCKAEIPNLEAVYNDYGGERFEMIGLSVDETIDLPKAFHEKKPPAYRQGFVSPERYKQIRNDYGIRSIPSIWLVGPDGKIVARDLRGEELREAVRGALEAPVKQD